MGQYWGRYVGGASRRPAPTETHPFLVWLCMERRSVVQQTKGLMRSGPSGF